MLIENGLLNKYTGKNKNAIHLAIILRDARVNSVKRAAKQAQPYDSTRRSTNRKISKRVVTVSNPGNFMANCESTGRRKRSIVSERTRNLSDSEDVLPPATNDNGF